MISRRPCGFTLVELLVTTTLLAVVGGGLAAAVATQWRSHDALADERRARLATGGAADLLLAELRALSPAAGDLRTASDTALELRATLGAAVICSVSVARDRIVVPPRQPAAGPALTWWRDMPAPGDSVDIFDGRGTARDTVSRHELVAMSAGSCSTMSGFVRSPGDASSSLALAISPPLPPSIGVGAPVRFLRWTRYSLYRSSTDNRWYFGIRELVSGAWTVVQPVAGPFASAAPLGSGGMSLVARDHAGAMIAIGPYDGTRALELALRTRGLRPARAVGRQLPPADSLQVVIAPRNE